MSRNLVCQPVKRFEQVLYLPFELFCKTGSILLLGYDRMIIYSALSKTAKNNPCYHHDRIKRDDKPEVLRNIIFADGR
jgi:hypothetical protein